MFRLLLPSLVVSGQQQYYYYPENTVRYDPYTYTQPPLHQPQQQQYQQQYYSQQSTHHDQGNAEAQKRKEPENTLYHILQVNFTADSAVVKKSFRKLSTKYHPDKNRQDTAAAAAKMEELVKAYETLSDEDKRQVYDHNTFGTPLRSFYTQYSTVSPPDSSTSSPSSSPSNPLISALSPQDFGAKVNNGQTWVVQFYVPSSKTSQEFTSHFVGIAHQLDAVRVGAVDCAKYEAMCARMAFPSWPTLHIYFRSKHINYDEVYSGGLTQTALVEHVQNMVEVGRKARISPVEPHHVELSLLQAQRPWIVLFSAGAWCQQCGGANNELGKLSAQHYQTINFGLLDCDAHKEFCEKRQVAVPEMRGWARMHAPSSSSSSTSRDPNGFLIARMHVGLPAQLVIPTISAMAELLSSSSSSAGSCDANMEDEQPECPLPPPCPKCPATPACPPPPACPRAVCPIAQCNCNCACNPKEGSTPS